MENRSYFESLEAKTKEMYREKLSCVGLSIQDDSYLPKTDARFVDNMPSGHKKSSAIHRKYTGLPKNDTLDANVKRIWQLQRTAEL